MSNLTLACERCNTKKGTQDLTEFLKDKPDVEKHILSQAKAPLKDAAAVNTTRWALFERLKTLGLPIECGSGGLTKYNRSLRGLPKTHWIDAACVGKSTPEQIHMRGIIPLLLTAVGRQRRQMCLMNKYGFPRTKAKESRSSHGFQTGDIVKACVPTGKRAGRYQGKVAIKASGSFSITTMQRTVPDISYRYCQLLHRMDGYSYQKGEAPHSSAAVICGSPLRRILWKGEGIMVEEQQHVEKRHKKASAIDYLFLSGVLALDLVNTEVVIRGRKYDLFSSPQDVARWWNEALRHHPDREMVKGETEAIVWSTALLEMIKRLRTAIQTLCTNVVEQEPLDPEALAFLNSILAMTYPSLEVISGNEVVPIYRTCETQQGSVLLPIALSAFHLLTQAEKHRLHKCKNDRCILFFYDMTKSATRHWCSLECMNRARSLQHYKQAKEKQARNS